jgi:hypothetical protein
MAAVKGLLVGVLLLAGCSSNTAWKVSTGTPHAGAQVQGAHVHVHSSGDLAAVLGVAILAGVMYEAAYGGLGYAVDSERRPPEMAPDRRISEQDCTKPLDYSLGNIRCK